MEMFERYIVPALVAIAVVFFTPRAITRGWIVDTFLTFLIYGFS